MPNTARTAQVPEPVTGLDPLISPIVEILRAHGVETFESCDSGDGHCFPEPTVRFFGNHAAGFHAVSVALTHALKVTALRRYWTIIDGEPTGPHWEMTFYFPATTTSSEAGIKR